jgi:hypothetical protein
MFLDGFDDGKVIELGRERCLASLLVSQGLVVEFIQPIEDAIKMGEKITETARKGLIAVPENGMADVEALARAQSQMRGVE